MLTNFSKSIVQMKLHKDREPGMWNKGNTVVRKPVISSYKYKKRQFTKEISRSVWAPPLKPVGCCNHSSKSRLEEQQVPSRGTTSLPCVSWGHAEHCWGSHWWHASTQDSDTARVQGAEAPASSSVAQADGWTHQRQVKMWRVIREPLRFTDDNFQCFWKTTKEVHNTLTFPLN